MEDLKSEFIKLVSPYSSNSELTQKLWLEIETAHNNKKRHYHNLSHLEYMTRLANLHKSEILDFDILRFSIFYHDIVYNVKRQNNEAKSALLAAERLELLGLSVERIARCVEQIHATKSHNDIIDGDMALLIDFDLAILGDTWEKYEAYAHNVRKEFNIYPDFLYNKGRKKVLQSFLDRERIFNTTYFFNEREILARENIKKELNGI